MKKIIIFWVLLISFFPLNIISQEISLEEYTNAVALSPETYRYKFLLYRGKAYVQEGKTNSALSDFSESILLKPTPEAYMERGKIYLDNGRFDAAIQDLNKALQLRTTLELHSLRSKTYLSKKMFTQALHDASEIVDLYPRHPKAYDMRISVYYEMEEYDKAVIDCDSALKINPKNNFARRMKHLSLENRIPPKIVLHGVLSPAGKIKHYGSSSTPKRKSSGSGTAYREKYKVPEKINRLKKAALGSGHHLSPGPVFSPNTYR
ncbi:MAG: tetratricopeptide repeat protein [Deltaproteobacteria bacterium]|jgi:tetratricopeptide (TPR) repeat protein|nr:tetratricopeptide repeat protein [Deltaproteobacteria bacterium]